MSKLVKKESMLADILKPPFGGIEVQSGGNKFPPVINILQSDKQYEAFGKDAEKLTLKEYGKLFIRRDEGNTVKDLKTKVEGTVLKIEYGHEIYREGEDGDRKIEGSGVGTINKSTRDYWLESHPGLTYKNMVKVIVSPSDDMKEIEAAMSAGANPFALLVIKGAGWGDWFKTTAKMEQLLQGSSVYTGGRLDEVLASAFRFKIKSQEVESQDGKFKFYVPAVEPVLNELEVAYQYKDIILGFKDVSLFYGVKEAVEKKETVDEKIEKAFEPKEEVIDLDKEETIDVDDLPF